LAYKNWAQQSIYLVMPAPGREPTFEKFELKAANPSRADVLEIARCTDLSGEIDPKPR
jgi:hypothetical protein